jgi:hypothetical protein
MAMTWVKVVRSDDGGVGDDLYMDGNYVDKAGKIGTPLRTQTGEHTFETVDGNSKPLWSKIETVDKPHDNAKTHPVVVTLEPAA